MTYEIHCVDAFDWLPSQSANSFQAIVTDPPYGAKEFTKKQLEKMRNGNGGVWRIPPSFDGAERIPQPRFTVLSDEDLNELKRMFVNLGKEAMRILVPGAHVIVASNTLLYPYAVAGLMKSGLELRGTLARLVRTLRGGDRPKNGHDDFPMVSSSPRSCWEPWLIFRKPFEGTLVDNLTKWKTGGLRRLSQKTPFLDVLESGRTPASERDIAHHPSLKPQSLMRYLVRSVLPLGEGVILDPFMGSGSTIAAAEYFGYESVGIERDPVFFDRAKKAIPRLAKLEVQLEGINLDSTGDDTTNEVYQAKLES